MANKATLCLWYDRDAEEAARFYAATFPDSSVGAIHRAPGDYPSGKEGDPMTVEFTICGVFEAMMPMRKLDVATIEAARRG